MARLTGKFRLVLLFALLTALAWWPRHAFCQDTFFDAEIMPPAKGIDPIDYFTKLLGVCHVYRGLAYKEKGDLIHAISDYSQAILLDPEIALSYNYRGLAYEAEGDLDRALADYSKAIELDPKMKEPYNNLGALLLKKGAMQEAVNDFTKAIAIDADFSMAYNNRGAAYVDIGEYDKAIADYTKSIELNTGNPYAIENLARVYYMQGNLDEALKQMEASMAVGNETYMESAYRILVEIYYEKGDAVALKKVVEQAEQFLGNEIAQKPQDGGNCASLAKVYCSAHVKPKEALGLAQKAVELKPDYYSYYVLGFAYLNNGDPQKAINNFEESRKLNPTDAYCLLRLGSAWLAAGDKEKAKSTWEEGLKINPKHRFILAELKKLADGERP